MRPWKVVVSGTVGPEAMKSSGFPTTSERMRAISVAGAAARASPPPLTWEMCLRTVLTSLMVAPLRRSRSVSCWRSSSTISPAGNSHERRTPAGNQAEDKVISTCPRRQLQNALGAPQTILIRHGVCRLNQLYPLRGNGIALLDVDHAAIQAIAKNLFKRLRHGSAGFAGAHDEHAPI